jgi:hypothetical protein
VPIPPPLLAMVNTSNTFEREKRGIKKGDGDPFQFAISSLFPRNYHIICDDIAQSG